MPGKRIIYQVLPRLWNAGSTFCGKFSGFDAASFEYIKSLGVSDIWYTGVIRHATRLPGFENAAAECVKGTAGSPYAITDYYDVNPYLADDPDRRMEEFEALVRRTHEAGFRVIIDFVPNHVARQYDGAMTPAGTPRLGALDDSSVHWKAENDFFYYPGEPLVLPVGHPEETLRPTVEVSYREFPARASGNCFSPRPDINDWYDTVKLNYCPFHTPTWDRMAEIVRFWALKGVDGFRCDMVELVPPEFFTWLIRTLKAEFPDLTFIAEVYEKSNYSKYSLDVGFDLLYDKSGLYDTLRAGNAAAITAAWQELGPLQPRMLNFLENHDEQRIASPQFAGSPEAGYAALGVSLLLNTAPFMLFFAQELGERGDPATGRTSIFDLTPVVPSLAKISPRAPLGRNDNAAVPLPEPGESATAITAVWQELGPLQPRMLNFLENHDEQRIASPQFAGSPEAGYAALGVSLLLNTAPFMLYFAQELGERGDPTTGRTSIFDLTPLHSVIPSPGGASVSPAEISPRAPLGRNDNSDAPSRHGRPDRPSCAAEAVLARYRTLLALAALPAFAEGGTWDLCYCQGPGFDRSTLFAWLRSDGRDAWLCLANFSPRPVTTDILIPAAAFAFFGLSALDLTVPTTVAPKDCLLLKL